MVSLYFFEREMVSGTLLLNRFVCISLIAKRYQCRRHELPEAPRLLFVPFAAPPAFVVRPGIPGLVYGGDRERCLFQGRLHSFTRAKHDLVHLDGFTHDLLLQHLAPAHRCQLWNSGLTAIGWRYTAVETVGATHVTT